jgi:mediator of RNA polymerase II transcription subunit 25
LSGGKSECNANLAEGLATALVCFQDLEKIRDKETSMTKQQHCILISNSSPYSMPVTECYEYEGRSVEQLASIFLERNINLSIISPRKIPVLFELFEKSGGDLALTASKNYSKDPRHLVLLKGFSLKERPSSPNINQQVQQAQIPTNQPNPATPVAQNIEQPVMVNSMPLNPNTGALRPLNPNIRQNTPIMQGAGPNQPTMNNPSPGFGNNQQMGNFPTRVANPQAQNQQQNNQQQQRWMANTTQARQPYAGQGTMQTNIMSGNMGQTNMMPQNQSNPNQPQQNSALISQLTQPPNINAMTPQQQAMARMAAMQNQQQNQQMLNQQGNANMNMVPGTMQNNPQMMVGTQQRDIQGGMTPQNQTQQGVQQMSNRR